jgi:DNA-binding response OmpR family regulator
MGPQRILVVDDDPQVLKYLVKSLERAGYMVESTMSSKIAAELIDRQEFDLLIADLSMPELDGFDLLRKTHISLKVLMISGFLDGVLLSAAKAMGAAAVMKKPIVAVELVHKVRDILMPVGDAAEEGI